MFFTANTAPDAVAESSGGSYISKSGIYDVILKIVSVDVNTHGARAINFNVEGVEDKSNTTFYGLKLDNNDGTPNYQAEIFNKLAIVCDIAVVNSPEPETHNLGKNATPTELQVLTDFTDLQVKIRVQEEYSKWQGQIKKKMVIKSFYSAAGAAAVELVNGSTPGVQLSKDEAYADKVTYKDGLTADDIEAWKNSKKDGGSAPAANTPVVKAPVKKLFT